MSTHTVHPDADTMFMNTVKDCYNYGDVIKTAKDTSRDLLCYGSILSNPLRRIVTNPNRPLGIISAVARFVWLASGSNRLEDIAFYEPKVAGYTDDGLTVPGSCYGNRLFDSAPGLNQIAGVIDRLDENVDSRQAAAVVWNPSDAVRKSNDIPCEFGMFFHVRNYELRMSNIMRSNNAFRLLPFNIFEFTMLGEVVAATLNIPFATYYHFAASMHVYTHTPEVVPTKEIAEMDLVPFSIAMEPMPLGNALEQLRALCVFEARLRHAVTGKEIIEILDKAVATLDLYWVNILAVLISYKTAKMHLNWRAFLPFGSVLAGLVEEDVIHKLNLDPKTPRVAKGIGSSDQLGETTFSFIGNMLSQSQVGLPDVSAPYSSALLDAPGGLAVSQAMFGNREGDDE